MQIRTTLFSVTIATLGPLFGGFFALSAAAAAEPTMVGIWFSPFQPDEPNVMSLIEFKADGTFQEEFRKCDNGEFIGFQTEAGDWSVSNDVEHITAKLINGDPATT